MNSPISNVIVQKLVINTKHDVNSIDSEINYVEI